MRSALKFPARGPSHLVAKRNEVYIAALIGERSRERPLRRKGRMNLDAGVSLPEGRHKVEQVLLASGEARLMVDEEYLDIHTPQTTTRRCRPVVIEWLLALVALHRFTKHQGHLASREETVPTKGPHARELPCVRPVSDAALADSEENRNLTGTEHGAPAAEIGLRVETCTRCYLGDQSGSTLLTPAHGVVVDVVLYCFHAYPLWVVVLVRFRAWLLPLVPSNQGRPLGNLVPYAVGPIRLRLQAYVEEAHPDLWVRTISVEKQKTRPSRQESGVFA